MTKWILLFSVALQITTTAVSSGATVSSDDFNTMIEALSHDQINTTHILWDSRRIKDYIRRKRTLQNTKTMIAETASLSETKN